MPGAVKKLIRIRYPFLFELLVSSWRSLAFLLLNPVSMRAKFGFGAFTLPVLFLLCSVPGCDTIPFPTGINGVAILEMGGGNVNPPPPITHEPLAGAIITVQPEQGGQEIARVLADPHGGFRIELPPGTYLLVAQVPPDQQFVITPPQQTVVVLPDRLTHVVVTYPVISHS